MPWTRPTHPPGTDRVQVNILVVAPWVPWPPSSGAHLRLANMLEALSEVGELDVFLVPSAPPRDSKPPKGLRLRRHVTFVSPPAGRVRRIFRAGRWLIGSRLPYEVHEHPRRWLRRAFAQWVEARYDLVWFTRLHMYALFEDLVAGPTILDVDDVEDRKARGRLAVLRRTRAGSLDPRWPLLAVHAAVNAQRWRRFQQRTIGGVDAALVCSEDDRRRLGGTNVIVVPNGYAAPARPAGRITVSDPPTLLLQGLLSYTPNTYGALWFAKAVLPRLGRPYRESGSGSWERSTAKLRRSAPCRASP